MTRLLAAALLSTLVVPAVTGQAPAAPRTLLERTAYLMGTRVQLATVADDRAQGLERLDRALAALENAERELSTWRPDSRISAFNRVPTGEPWHAGARLCRMFDEVFRRHLESGGAFDPAIDELVDAWKLHEDGAVPTPSRLDEARQRSGLRLVAFDRERCTLAKRTDVRLDVGAFGKGEALDRALEELDGHSVLIDLGGQVSVAGAGLGGLGWMVDVAHPLRRGQPVFSLRLTNGSLATSGGSERDLVVDGQRVGHLLDPRTGRPASFQGSVVVWHERGLSADILSTALYVMGPDAGLPWADLRRLAAAYLVPEPDGTLRVVSTSAFRKLAGAPATGPG